jgi:hypothetical protein
MALSFLYLMTRRLLGMLLGRFQSEHAKDVEIAVLRHQLEVLRRQVKRPEFRPAGRALLAVLSSALPRGRWPVFLVARARSCGGTAGWWPASGRSLTVAVAVRRCRPRGGADPAAGQREPRWGYQRVQVN